MDRIVGVAGGRWRIIGVILNVVDRSVGAQSRSQPVIGVK
jgi:hypothetical protein